MSQPPCQLTRHIREFAAQLRIAEALSPMDSVRNYREFLRSNVAEVIASVFPLFSREAGRIRVESLAAAFLTDHAASEAEFHQIATEFVRFIHGREEVNSDERQLIEYEWMLFYVEIAPEPVTTSGVSPAVLPRNSTLKLALNPTLHCVRLPFVISAGEPVRQHPAEEAIWGIFRNRHHEVLQKRLLSFDRTLLHLLLDRGISSLAALRQALSAEEAQQLDAWLISNQDTDFISLQEG